jgi:DNA polymerase I-like protein with 3'-5' exonuclease and polymerase domains
MNRLSAYEDDVLQPALMIHDDLTFMIPDERFDDALDTIITEMLRMEYPWLNVPLGVEIKAGRDWFSQKMVGKFESSNTGGYVEIT